MSGMHAFLARPDTPALAAALAILAAALLAGLAQPPLFFVALAALVAAGIVFLAFRFTIGFCVVWLLVTSMTLEMTLHDLIGDEAFQPTIAAVKAVGIGLALVCGLRYGFRSDLLSPAYAFVFMLGAGLVHGLHDGLSGGDSVRSTIGSIAPFAFCFCRPPRHWCDAMIQATRWAPFVAIIACLPLTAAGFRPLFVDEAGLRLAGLGHPAFLAGVCLAAIYACLVELYRNRRRGDVWLLGANFLLLVLTGARAPFGSAALVTAVTLTTIPSEHFPARTRLTLVLLGLTALPLAVLLAGTLDDVRLFNVMLNDTADLSGRTLLWPAFQEAAAQSPWVGWGIGAGNAIIPPDGRIAQLMHTWAAHNEYLRLQVEGGLVGEGLLIGLFVAWIWRHTTRLPAAERRIIRVAFGVFAVHAFTDNLLISTPACVLFAFVAAVFGRARAD